jgi:hypothetical protein
MHFSGDEARAIKLLEGEPASGLERMMVMLTMPA